jgi:lipopolysaccharide transport protein LptA
MRVIHDISPFRHCLVLLLAAPVLALGQVTDLDMRLPMDIDADNTTLDGKNSMIVFSGLRLTQGQVSIEADEGRATRMDLEDSYWQFTGNVVIDVGSGRIQCDSAELYFDDFRLQSATVTGAPAIYDLQREGSDDVTHAEAGRLDYDVNSGVIRFSDQATITEGGNQISSNVLVYNIAEQRINADSTGADDGRVRITYTPANGVEPPGENDAETEPADDAEPAVESEPGVDETP